jgi:4-hydroxythreonine-4-phosphate dehydrogenase
MYHDQGHIPMKLIDFERTVNISLGIPIIRTSVDHGTAFDIAGQDRADCRNMQAAMRMAARMAAGRLLRPSAARTSAPREAR